MRKIIILLLFSCCILPFSAFSQESSNELVIADFNSGSQPNNIGGIFGTWDYDPNDETQSCVMEFSALDVTPNTQGFAMRLNYDVQSPNPAFNGFWMKLEGQDITPYNRLRFWVKGDEALGYTSRFKVELKNALGKRAVYLIKNVTADWREVVIEFKKTRAIKDWTQMSEFTVVFSDLVSTFREGVIYIDNIAFLYVPELQE